MFTPCANLSFGLWDGDKDGPHESVEYPRRRREGLCYRSAQPGDPGSGGRFRR
jgi:hypothetical protein